MKGFYSIIKIATSYILQWDTVTHDDIAFNIPQHCNKYITTCQTVSSSNSSLTAAEAKRYSA